MRIRRERKSLEHPSLSEEIGNALEYAWGPVLCSVLLSAALAFPDASHEALLSIVENTRRDWPGLVAAVVTLLAFLILPAVLNAAARYALQTNRYFGPHCGRVELILLAWVGRLPLAAACVALVRILSGSDQPSPGAKVLIWIILALFAFLVLTGFHAFGHKDDNGRSWFQRDRAPRIVRAINGLYSRCRDFADRIHLIFCAMAAILLLAVAIHPPLAAGFGPITVALLFVAVMAILLAWLTRKSARHAYGRIPLVIALIGFGIAASGKWASLVFLGVMAIYAFCCFFWPGQASRKERRLATVLLVMAGAICLYSFAKQRTCPSLAGCNLIAGIEAPAAAELGESFRQWQQQHRQAAPGQPIRLIAAEGGGLFAAYYTAMYLAMQADLDPANYPQSIFAISGVSGGSVGAATFWAIRRSGICATPVRPDCHQHAVRQILARDYLSPVMARMLTWDMLDTVLPLSSVNETWRLERATQLERELIRHADAMGALGLGSSLIASWSVADRVPALFLNATRVETGNRIIQSPFAEARSPGYPSLPLRMAPDGGGDIPVATAAFISARFPVVTPPARIQIDGGVRQVVDGGYFDNSGIETIHDLLRRMPLDKDTPPVAVVMLTTENAPLNGQRRSHGKKPPPSRLACAKPAAETPLAEPYKPRSDRMQGLFANAVAAIMGARKSRLQMSRHRAVDFWVGSSDPNRPRMDIVANIMCLSHTNYTVSWYLDRETFCAIDRQLEADIKDRRNPRQPLPDGVLKPCPADADQ